MAVHLLEPTDTITVEALPVVIFGPPGSWKTTLAQTGENPLTLDLDEGLHRAGNRKRGLRFDTWADVEEATRDGTFAPYNPLVVDTLGRLLDKIIPVVRSASPKNCGPGGLSPQGWGVLGSTFTTWVKTVREMKKDLVLLCHEEVTKNGNGEQDVSPDLLGKMSWKEVHKWTDLIGRIRYEGRDRVLDFNPVEGAVCCKNAAGFNPIKLPDLRVQKTFLADLLKEAKARIGKTAEASAAAARLVNEWVEWLATDPSLEALNARLPDISKLKNGVKAQVWNLVSNRAEKAGLHFDKDSKTFKLPEGEK